jgi:hypothetical protein
MFLWPFGTFAYRFLDGRDVGCHLYSLLIILLKPSQTRMYDRTLKPIPEPTSTGLRYRIETLFGKTGIEMAKYRSSWREVILSPFEVVWRPHLLSALVFEVCDYSFSIHNKLTILQALFFGFTIGIGVTQVVFLGSPPPFGYGLGTDSFSLMYATPLVSHFQHKFKGLTDL